MALKTLSETLGRLPGFEYDTNRAPRRWDFLALENAAKNCPAMWGHQMQGAALGLAGAAVISEGYEWRVWRGEFEFFLKNSAGPRVREVRWNGQAIYTRRRPITHDSSAVWAKMRAAAGEAAASLEALRREIELVANLKLKD